MINLEIQGADDTKIYRLVSDAIAPRVVLAAIGARFVSFIDQSFRTAGRGHWRPLASSTLQLRKHGGDAILQDSGRYKQSFVPESDSTTFVEVGTNLKTESGASLGKIHEFGTGPYTIRAKRARMLAAQTRGGGWLRFGVEVHHPGLPARPVLPTKEEAEVLAVQTIDAMLTRITASKGG